MPPHRAIALGGLAAALALVGPVLLHQLGASWLVRVFGAAAPTHALVAGVAGAALAGATVAIVLATLRASQPVFLSAWVSTTLARLAALGLLAVFPAPGAGATQGLLIGYVAAVVLGSAVEVPVIWLAGGRPAASPAGAPA